MKLIIEEIAVGDLKASPRNARTHDERQIAQIRHSIQTFGFTNPALIDEMNVIIAGHGRLEAAKRQGLATVPTIRLSHLTEAQKRALMLADNKIALNAGWNIEILASELTDLSAMPEIDIGVIGFEVPEIDLVIGEARKAEGLPVDPRMPDLTRPAITRPGDLWDLGPHRVLCGDARNPQDYETLLQGERAAMGFADPPYNVRINGHVCGKGQVHHREFAEASGEMTPEEFQAFLTETFHLCAHHSGDNAIWYAMIDWRHIGEMLAAGLAALGPQINLCVWAKTNAGMGSLYRSQHELVFVFANANTRRRNNVQLGKFGRNRSNLWTYPGVNTFRPGRMEELQAHPTPKPVALVEDAILDVSARGEIVLDPFMGAGSTLIAAERAGRVARGLEIDPLYVDVILLRWRAETGDEPVRAGDGRPLAEIEAEAQPETAK